MSDHEKKAAAVAAPIGGGDAPRAAQRLANTGTTESHNSTLLALNEMATIMVGAAAIRVSFRAATAGATQVATTDPIIPAYGRFDWLVTPLTACVYVEAADGSAAYEAHVWSSSV